MAKGSKLTAKQKRFCEEYLVDLNATKAAIRAGYSARNADKIGSELLGKTRVAESIQKAQQKLSERTQITAEMVLQRWWDIATADPNDIIHVRRVCCRHCFGVDHQYQWRDELEYQQAALIAIESGKAKGEEPIMPSDSGGYGYDRLLRPHPKCPYCQGEGLSELHVEDTRHLGPKAKLLYAGVKQTAAGIEIKMKDQDKALENVARHLGMFVEKHELTGADGGSLVIEVAKPKRAEDNG